MTASGLLVTDAAVEAARKAFWRGSEDQMRAALTAALPHLVGGDELIRLRVFRLNTINLEVRLNAELAKRDERIKALETALKPFAIQPSTMPGWDDGVRKVSSDDTDRAYATLEPPHVAD